MSRRSRRLAAVLLTAAGTALALTALRPAAGVPVTVAARDLGSGTLLTSADVRTVRVSPDAVPAGTTASPVGRTLAGPMRRGEAFTDARLLTPHTLLSGLAPDRVATPVRIADPEVAGLLRPGDRIDVLVSRPPETLTETRPFASARIVAAAVPVLAVPRPTEASRQGALVVLATDRGQAAALAGAAGTLSAVLTSP